MHDAMPSRPARRASIAGRPLLFKRGRLKPGKTIEQARANLTLLGARLAADYPVEEQGSPYRGESTSDVHFHPSIDRSWFLSLPG